MRLLKRPTKQIVLPALGIAVLACVGFWVWQAIFPPEPLYHGKRLGRWLEEASFSAGPTLETTAAIQGMGTDALPVLLRMVAARDSDFKQGLANVGGARLLRFFRLVPAQHYHLRATWGFDALGPRAKPAVPALTKLLTASDEDVSSTAAYCLGVIGPAAAPAVPLLIQCLSNAVTKGSSTRPAEAFLKERTAIALGKIGAASAPAIPILTVASTDSMWYVRNAAKATLMRLKGESVVPLIEQLRDTSDPIKWYEAAMLVSDFGTNAGPAVPLLVQALGSSNDIILGHAAVALGRIRLQPEVCVPALIPLLNSPSVSTRQKSLIALGEFGRAATSAIPNIRFCLSDSDPWVRARAPAILKMIQPAGVRAK